MRGWFHLLLLVPERYLAHQLNKPRDQATPAALIPALERFKPFVAAGYAEVVLQVGWE